MVELDFYAARSALASMTDVFNSAGDAGIITDVDVSDDGKWWSVEWTRNHNGATWIGKIRRGERCKWLVINPNHI